MSVRHVSVGNPRKSLYMRPLVFIFPHQNTFLKYLQELQSSPDYLTSEVVIRLPPMFPENLSQCLKCLLSSTILPLSHALQAHVALAWINITVGSFNAICFTYLKQMNKDFLLDTIRTNKQLFVDLSFLTTLLIVSLLLQSVSFPGASQWSTITTSIQ